MAVKKGKKNGKSPEKDIAGVKINELLDHMISYAKGSPQMDTYYKDKIDELADIEKDYLPIVTKRFLKEGSAGREVLLELLKHFSGIAHITFLQKFVKNEVFMPKIGTRILDIFNKSDLILEEGIAGNLLELENLTQRIKHALLTGAFDATGKSEDALIRDFLKTRPNEREGMLLEVIEDTGFQAITLILKAAEKEPEAAENMIKITAALPETKAVEMLQGIYEGTASKAVQKYVKRITHALKQKGLDIRLDTEKQDTGSVFRKAELPSATAYSSIIDAEGHRFIFVVKPVTAHENKIFNILLGDMAGIKDIEVMTAVGKETKTLIKKILSDEKTEFFEIPVEYASFLIEEARKLNMDKGTIVSANISQWDSLFAGCKSVRQETFIYDLVNKEKIREEALSQEDISLLFDKKDMSFWFLTTDFAKDQWLKISESFKDGTGADSAQTKERIDELRKEALKLFFDHERIRAFKRRLEETAYCFQVKGDEDKAWICLKAAFSISDPGFQPEENIFCREIIKSGYDFFMSAYEEEARKRQSGVSG